mgnify:CR=1 FL=1
MNGHAWTCTLRVGCRWLVSGLVLVGLWLQTLAPARAAERVQVRPEVEAQVLQVIRDHPEVILESLQAYQQRLQREQSQRQAAFLAQLQANPAAMVADSPRLGSSSLRWVLLEFSDFQCPFCARAVATVQQFVRQNPEVTLVFKHLPLSRIHPEAQAAARAAWAAQQQGQFWPYHDRLFAQQERLGEALYLAIARELNLDLARFERDRQRADAAIERDLAQARELGVTGTPFFVLGGEVLEGAVDLPALQAALKRGQAAAP